MSVRGIGEILAEHEVFRTMSLEHAEVIAGCARNAVFEAGHAVFGEGDPADTFMLIRHGRVALRVAVPGRGDIAIETLGPGDVLGWSWVVPPYRRNCDAEALEPTRAVVFDGACIRGKFEADAALGYDMLARFVPVVAHRLHATQIRLLDVYGHGSG